MLEEAYRGRQDEIAALRGEHWKNIAFAVASTALIWPWFFAQTDAASNNAIKYTVAPLPFLAVLFCVLRWVHIRRVVTLNAAYIREFIEVEKPPKDFPFWEHFLDEVRRGSRKPSAGAPNRSLIYWSNLALWIVLGCINVVGIVHALL